MFSNFSFLNIYRATAIQLDGEKQWKIVAPLLPANDSLLYSYVASSETLSSSMISPLHTILGGLTLTAQLLCQIASCIDIIFPKRSSMTDFGNFLFKKKDEKKNPSKYFIYFLNLQVSIHLQTNINSSKD